jgi:hypothetical protein
MIRTATGILTAVLVLVPAALAAQVSTEHIATDAEMLEYLSDTMFVAEGRIGDRGGAATFELDLGQDTGAPGTTAQYDWQSGVAEPFTLTYDHFTGQVTFSLGGIVLNYTTPYFDFDQVFVRTRATEEGTSILVDDLVIDGDGISDQSAAVGNGLDILWIKGANLNNGFVLTGVATLTWTGTPPTQSRLAFQIKIGKAAIVATEESTWGRIKRLTD